MRVIDDGEIGMCDDCSSEDGTRTRVLRDVTINGERVRVAVHLCDDCKSLKKSA